MLDSGKISLIIPCYFANEELVEMTMDCMNSLLMSDFYELSEVITIDDGSPIEVTFIDDNLDTKFITLRKEKNGGYASAVNMGLFHATGDILILGNNDLTFPEKWVTELLRPLQLGYDVATCWTSDQDNIEIEDYIEYTLKYDVAVINEVLEFLLKEARSDY
jgi:glycosyltransferase involved in cell wall biosynthesis